MNIYEIPGALNETQRRHTGTECHYSPQGDLTSALFMAMCDLYDEDQFRYLCVCVDGIAQCFVGRQNDEIDVVATEEALAQRPDFNAVLDGAWSEAQSRHAQYLTFTRLGLGTKEDLQKKLTVQIEYPTLRGLRNDN